VIPTLEENLKRTRYPGNTKELLPYYKHRIVTKWLVKPPPREKKSPPRKRSPPPKRPTAPEPSPQIKQREMKLIYKVAKKLKRQKITSQRVELVESQPDQSRPVAQSRYFPATSYHKAKWLQGKTVVAPKPDVPPTIVKVTP
jgi:nucleoid-associated protein YgaU